LTSQWNTTVQTFHKKFGGKMFLDEMVEGKVKLKFSTLKSHVQEMLNDSGYSDPWDAELFQHAEKLFLQYSSPGV